MVTGSCASVNRLRSLREVGNGYDEDVLRSFACLVVAEASNELGVLRYWCSCRYIFSLETTLVQRRLRSKANARGGVSLGLIDRYSKRSYRNIAGLRRSIFMFRRSGRRSSYQSTHTAHTLWRGKTTWSTSRYDSAFDRRIRLDVQFYPVVYVDGYFEAERIATGFRREMGELVLKNHIRKQGNIEIVPCGFGIRFFRELELTDIQPGILVYFLVSQIYSAQQELIA